MDKTQKRARTVRATIPNLAVVATYLVMAVPAAAQPSESTNDWPVWQKVAVASIGASSLLVTLASVGLANADSETGESQSGNGNFGGDGARKSQGYVEELTDELLAFVQESRRLTQAAPTDTLSLESMAAEFPVLADYYSDLLENHPEVIAEVDLKMEGATRLDRLNSLMLVHLFAGAASGTPSK
ncbi:MAG: hypothetical protein KDD65_12975 [Bacteroidetes bacterium]|nr:hypothetical protein [Bacteroidota bacterium]